MIGRRVRRGEVAEMGHLPVVEQRVIIGVIIDVPRTAWRVGCSWIVLSP
ncbi:MAG: hypothetical protein EOM93_07520 [Gammaproteobacteria bacterium]|nr:hypothetical protein [Gammaproteobacteria bacterium]